MVRPEKLTVRQVKRIARRGDSLVGADLSGLDLRGIELMGADLARANLEAADLSQADLTWANLSEANLRRAVLIETGLAEAKLTRANLEEAKISGALLGGADLRQANLTNADLSGRPEYRVRQAVAAGIDLSMSPYTYRTELVAANLDGAILTKANLERVNLGYANLTNARLDGAKLKGAYLRKANLKGAVLEDGGQEADLEGADLTDATMPDGSLYPPDDQLTSLPSVPYTDSADDQPLWPNAVPPRRLIRPRNWDPTGGQPRTEDEEDVDISQGELGDPRANDLIDRTEGEPDSKRAIQLLHRALRYGRTGVQASKAYQGLGMRYEELGDTARAIKYYTKAMEAWVPKALLLFWRGELYYQRGQWAEARSDFERALAFRRDGLVSPDREQAEEYLVELKKRLGDS